jgi:hypothetical protein
VDEHERISHGEARGSGAALLVLEAGIPVQPELERQRPASHGVTAAPRVAAANGTVGSRSLRRRDRLCGDSGESGSVCPGNPP